ncbi:MAG TPA: hypothetical protein VK982_03080, partial [Bacteroidales bacterium]|nr:hypothetical protein [Bacteroidales bacterium]
METKATYQLSKQSIRSILFDIVAIAFRCPGADRLGRLVLLSQVGSVHWPMAGSDRHSPTNRAAARGR